MLQVAWLFTSNSSSRYVWLLVIYNLRAVVYTEYLKSESRQETLKYWICLVIYNFPMVQILKHCNSIRHWQRFTVTNQNQYVHEYMTKI
jgi:hypothetical protein